MVNTVKTPASIEACRNFEVMVVAMSANLRNAGMPSLNASSEAHQGAMPTTPSGPNKSPEPFTR